MLRDGELGLKMYFFVQALNSTKDPVDLEMIICCVCVESKFRLDQKF